MPGESLAGGRLRKICADTFRTGNYGIICHTKVSSRTVKGECRDVNSYRSSCNDTAAMRRFTIHLLARNQTLKHVLTAISAGDPATNKEGRGMVRIVSSVPVLLRNRLSTYSAPYVRSI